MYQRYLNHCRGQERWFSIRNKWQAVRTFTELNSSITIPPGKSLLKDDVLSWSTSFKNVMRSEVGRQIFTKFLETEYSDENMMFWNACEDLRKEDSYAKRKNMMQDIYEMFIAPAAPLEVNLESRMKAELLVRMERADRTVFKAAQDSIYMLMERDCYHRFTKSKVYRDFLDTVEMSSQRAMTPGRIFPF